MGLFNTTANTYANSFEGVQNAAYNNPGWGMDPNLMTPGYAASYRPGYSGTNPYVSNASPSFLQGAGRLVNPFYTPPLHQSAAEAYDPYAESFSTKPFDAAMWAGQRVIAPAIAYGAAAKFLGPNTKSMMGDITGAFTGKGVGASFGKGVAQGFAGSAINATGLGGSGGMQMNASIKAFNEASVARSAQYAKMVSAAATEKGLIAKSVGMAGRAAHNIGTAGSAMSAAYSAGGLSGAAALGVRGAAGVLGSVAGSVAVPYAAAEATMWGLDKAVFSPYVNTRQTARDLRSNFSGVTFSDAQGDPSNGGGLGRKEAAKIAQKISKDGIQDFGFSTDEYTAIANMSAKTGLLDSTKSQDIAKKVKSISEQIKMVISISKDPSVEKAFEELHKLNMGGASLVGVRNSGAASAYSKLGMHASAAGTTVQRMMSEVGDQGQMLYQMNGMTPYLGQVAAAGIYSGFASAKRTGLMSSEQLARMGGVAGATQSALTGQVNSSQTVFNKMDMYNRYMSGMGGDGANSVTDVVSRFGAGVGNDPLEASGSLALFGAQMASKQSRENGSSSSLEQATRLLDSIGARRNSDGQYSAAQIMAAYKQMGNSDSEAIAMINDHVTSTDPEVLAQKSKAYRKQALDQSRSFADSEGLVNSIMGRTAHVVGQVGRNTVKAISGAIVDPVVDAGAWVGDAYSKTKDALWYDDTVGQSKGATSDALFTDHSKLLRDAGFDKLTEGAKAGADASKDTYRANFKSFDTSSSYFGTDAIASAMRSTDYEGKYADGQITRDEVGSIGESLNKMASSPNHPGFAAAAAFMRETDPAKKKTMLAELVRSHPKEFAEGTHDRLFGSGYNKSKGLDNAAATAKILSKVQNKDTLSTVDRDAKNDFVSSLDKTVGRKDQSSYKDLLSIGSVDSVAQGVAAGKIDVANINEIIAKDKTLANLVGDRRSQEALDYITDIHNRARSEGHLGKGQNARSVGTVDQVNDEPGRIADAGYKKKFLDARGNIEAQEQILLEYTTKLGGGTTSETTTGGTLSLKDSANMANAAREEAASKSMDVRQQMKTQASLATNSYSSKVSALDKPVGEFSDAVKDFVKAVAKMSGTDPSKITSGPGSTAPSLFSAEGWDKFKKLF